jgi:hypothetical protein
MLDLARKLIVVAMLSILLKLDNFIINLVHHVYKSFYLFRNLLCDLLDDFYLKQPYIEK